MKFLIYSSILLSLISCFLQKSQALKNTGRHFHTLDITSLLPASVCTHSTDSRLTPINPGPLTTGPSAVRGCKSRGNFSTKLVTQVPDSLLLYGPKKALIHKAHRVLVI
ncbi:hypothetical protein CASFOL_023021 [Castilleja foliolosa]|uniref:Uncharacterized protein n=1 Tax=Castilleja foliolosa TaxID=1961234 RepID=A0ABD3CKN3_9LAMI